MGHSDRDTLHELLKTRGGFGHREHLELAWRYLNDHPVERAEAAMADAIRTVATMHGAPDKYHDTITRTWVRLVAVHRAADAAPTFDDFLEGNAGLLDRHLLGRHYSEAVLGSDEARFAWVTPDLRPLPAHT
jgi:hypothetical protein